MWEQYKSYQRMSIVYVMQIASHWILVDVRIPRGHGGCEAHSYIRLALGFRYLELVCVVRQGFWWGWWVVVRNASNIRPNCAQGSMVKGMSTIFYQSKKISVIKNYNRDQYSKTYCSNEHLIQILSDLHS